jgi:hypothetical protein
MKLRRIIPLSLIAILVLQVVILPFQASALRDSFFYNSNGIMFYDPDAVDCTSAQSLGEAIAVEKTETTDTIYAFLTKTKLSSNGNRALSPAQAAGVMGNMYAESGFNPSAIEATDREQKGHGLVQWTFGRWDNLEAFAEEQGKPWDDLNTQLKFLEKELEGSEKAIFNDSLFNDAKEPAIAAMRFRIIFERADPTVAHDDRREGAAIWAFKEYANGSASAECISGNGIVAGNLVETAINFALDKPAEEGMNTKAHARDTYQVAKEKYNPSVHWTDCGGFIATVMYATGVDKDFPNVNTDTQSAYVRGNPDKYLIIENFSLADLQPGDLLYTGGHVTMYTGKAQYPSVDASFYNPSTGEGGRVPSVRNSGSAQWMKDNGAFIARILK